MKLLTIALEAMAFVGGLGAVFLIVTAIEMFMP